MKKFKYMIFAGCAILFAFSTHAQDEPIGYYEDALRFSMTSPLFGGTARIQGIGGAQVSLGADMSSAWSNPAGLGFYNRSVFSITPGMNFNNREVTYLSRTSFNHSNHINLPNMGVVFNTNKGDYTDEGFKGGSFAISFNKTNNLSREWFYNGRNNKSSIIDSYAENASLSGLFAFSEAAFETYLIDADPNVSGGYVPYRLIFPDQQESISEKGGQSQLNFSWGGNYNDMVYFGGGVGIASLDWRRTRTFTENNITYLDGNTERADDQLNYSVNSETIDLSGTGINATLGLIVRPANFVTIGLSYLTPTYYSIDELYSFRMEADWNNVKYNDGTNTTILGNEVFESDVFESNYTLRVPGKLTLGSTLFLGKNGFISGDLEMVDYSNSFYNTSSEVDFSADNSAIAQLYGRSVNLRLGGELRLDNFRARVGTAHFGNPNVGGDDLFVRSFYTLGGGYRNRDFFLDVAVVKGFAKLTYSPYSFSADTPVADIDEETTSVSATLGFNF